MFITIASPDGNSAQIEVGSDTSLEIVKSLVSVELGLPGSQFGLSCNGRALPEGSTVGAAGIVDQDLVLVEPAQQQAAASRAPPRPAAAPAPAAAADMLRFFSENPTLLPQLRHVDADLAAAVESRDVGKLRTAIMMQQMQVHKRQWERETERARLEADPSNPENQQRIEEMIRRENIEQNLAMAMEETPEAFGRVTMLYIDMEVNGRHIKAFVDSGAQSTIMSLTCAERCGLTHLIDKRFAGEARGVGVGKILGRIHMSHIKIGGTFFPCSFTILEKSDVEFLFGLDMLRRHHCVMDLKQSTLAFGSTGVSVSFLGEADLPANARGTTEADLNNPNGDEGGGGGDIMETSIATEGTAAAPPAEAAVGAAATAAGAPAAAVAAAGPLGTAAPPAAAPAAAATDDAKIQQLVNLGFPRQQAVAALSSTGGDVEQAAGLLLAQFGG
ncbi:unnamed protein product [Phaeothamnion confervicola]